MVHINTDFSKEQDDKIELVKALKKVPTKQDSIKIIVDEYDVDKAFKERDKE